TARAVIQGFAHHDIFIGAKHGEAAGQHGTVSHPNTHSLHFLRTASPYIYEKIFGRERLGAFFRLEDMGRGSTDNAIMEFSIEGAHLHGLGGQYAFIPSTYERKAQETTGLDITDH